jgi:phospholipase/carboxylesterase
VRIKLRIIVGFCGVLAALTGAAAAAGDAAPAADVTAFLDADWNQVLKSAGQAYDDKRYADAAGLYTEYLRAHVDDGGVIYSLACCYGLLGDGDAAAATLKRAWAGGFRDLGWIEQDPDFASVREKPAFAAAVASLEAEAGAGSATFLFVPASAWLPCRVFVPADYDAARSYPLIVGLHGLGGNAETFSVLWEDSLKTAGVIFAVPEAPYAFNAGSEPGFSWGLATPTDAGEFETEWLDACKGVQQYLADLIAILKARYNCGGCYVLGFSQGGAVAYGAATHGLPVAGIIVFGGPFSDDEVPPDMRAAAKGIRVFIAHGTQDNVVPPPAAAAARDAFVAAGCDVTYREFDGGHNVDRGVLAEAIAWVKQ